MNIGKINRNFKNKNKPSKNNSISQIHYNYLKSDFIE